LLLLHKLMINHTINQKNLNIKFSILHRIDITVDLNKQHLGSFSQQFRPQFSQLAYFHDNYFDSYFSAVVTVLQVIISWWRNKCDNTVDVNHVIEYGVHTWRKH